MATFSKRDGIVFHMRFLGDCLFYVKDTRNLIRYDMRQKSSSLVGTTNDTVVALYVTRNRMR